MFLFFMQMFLVWFILLEAQNYQEYYEALTLPANSEVIVFARFFCAVVLHIYMNPEIEQSFLLMKYALNHFWKFRFPGFAFGVGFMQMAVTLSVELVNLVVLNTNHSIMDIIMNFLALVIIAEFDDAFILAI